MSRKRVLYDVIFVLYYDCWIIRLVRYDFRTITLHYIVVVVVLLLLYHFDKK